MIIYPAIDIQNGKCVMLEQGIAEASTVYGDSPVEIALRWKSLGAEYIHVIDLDAAIYGEDRGNLSIIEDMRRALDIPIQVGGGIRDTQKLIYLLDTIGIDRVIIGTLAIENTHILKDLARKYRGRIAVSIDAKDGLVAIKGWTENSNRHAIDLCHEIGATGIETIIYTDISRDGMLQGPNLEFSKELIHETGLEVIVSGGVTTLQDIEAIRAINASGAIIGKGLYDDRIDLKRAIQVGKGAL